MDVNEDAEQEFAPQNKKQASDEDKRLAFIFIYLNFNFNFNIPLLTFDFLFESVYKYIHMRKCMIMYMLLDI